MVRASDTVDASASGPSDVHVHRAMAIDRMPRPAFEPPAAYLVGVATARPASGTDAFDLGRAVLVACGTGGPRAG
jgi:hypothetical protein